MRLENGYCKLIPLIALDFLSDLLVRNLMLLSSKPNFLPRTSPSL